MKDFTHGHISSQILLFSLPIIAGNLLMQLYQMVDSAIVGQYIGTNALAAVGASNPVIFAIISMVMGIGGGASVVISQYFGRGNLEKVRLTCDTLHIVLLVCGALIGAIGILFSDNILRFMGLPSELVPLGYDYLSVYLGGIFLLFGFNTIVAIMRGVGDSRTPLYFLLLSSVLNIGLDFLFIVHFEWGVASAAWATVISQGFAYFMAILYINSNKKIVFHINLFRLKFHKKIFSQCLRFGLPTGFQQSFVAFGMVAIFSIINGYGTNTIAAISAAMRVDSIAVLPAMNFALALSSFVGQNIGAGKLDRVKRGLRSTLIISSSFCVVQSIVLVLFGKYILGFFTSEVEVIEIGYRYLVSLSLFYILFSVMQAITGLFRGAGAVIFPMIATFVAMWLGRLPVAKFLSEYSDLAGVDVISVSVVVGWAVGTGMVVWYYFYGNWSKKSIFERKND